MKGNPTMRNLALMLGTMFGRFGDTGRPDKDYMPVEIEGSYRMRKGQKGSIKPKRMGKGHRRTYTHGKAWSRT